MNSNRLSPSRTPQKALSAICGLFCAACPVYIGTVEDRPRLEKMAEQFGRPLEDMECEGCRSENICALCKEKCKMLACAVEKGIDFCVQCEEFPCDDLKEFQAAMPNRIELWKSLKRIKEAGYEQWYMEMLEHYACPECGAINSVRDDSCRKCSFTPSCRYVEIHRKEIDEIREKLKQKRAN